MNNIEHKLVLHELELGAYASELELELRAYRKQMFRFEIYAHFQLNVRKEQYFNS
jgi:hypothetical protein